MKQLNPRGAIVVLEAEHMCMGMRGVKKSKGKKALFLYRGRKTP